MFSVEYAICRVSVFLCPFTYRNPAKGNYEIETCRIDIASRDTFQIIVRQMSRFWIEINLVFHGILMVVKILKIGEGRADVGRDTRPSLFVITPSYQRSSNRGCSFCHFFSVPDR